MLRRVNLDLVLRSLQRWESLTVSELHLETGLSRPTLAAVADELIDRGLVSSTVDNTAAGRPARRLQFCADAGHVVGVDIGRERIHVLISDLGGQVQAEEERTVKPTLARAGRVEAVRSTVEASRESAGLDGSDLKAVCAGTPGAVDPVSGIVSMCEVLPEWSGFNLRDHLEAALKLPVVIENDANLVAVGERWRGAAQACEHAVALVVGDRPGAGIIANGSLLHGHQGWAGELFMWQLWHDNYSRNPGPLAEPARAVVAALAKLMKESDPLPARRGSSPAQVNAALDLNAACEGLRIGDQHAVAALEMFFAGAAWVIASLASLIGPERVIVSGLPQIADDFLIKAWQAVLSDLVPATPTILAASNLGNRATALGAMHQALLVAQENLQIDLLTV